MCRDSEEVQARMESSMGVAEQARQRMESRLLAKEKEIGALENKVGILKGAAPICLWGPNQNGSGDRDGARLVPQ